MQRKRVKRTHPVPLPGLCPLLGELTLPGHSQVDQSGQAAGVITFSLSSIYNDPVSLKIRPIWKISPHMTLSAEIWHLGILSILS